MGRPRTKSPTWLPRRVYPHGAQLLYRPRVGKPIPLGPLSDPAACLAKYAKLVADRPSPRTLGDVFDRYLLEVVPMLAPRTQADYREYVGKLRHAFGHMLPDDVTQPDLYAYHEARRAPVRANREITILGRIYSHAIRWRAATRNPVDGFLYAAEPKRERAVSLAELRAFNRAAPRWLRVYLLLKLLTGLRQGDLLRLGAHSVDRERGLLRVRAGKTGRTLEFRLTWALRACIRAAEALPRPREQLLWFCSQKGATRGQALTARGFKSAWARAMAAWLTAGGEHFREHDVRAATADHAARRAADLLGHESERVTKKHYLRGARRVTPLR